MLRRCGCSGSGSSRGTSGGWALGWRCCCWGRGNIGRDTRWALPTEGGRDRGWINRRHSRRWNACSWGHTSWDIGPTRDGRWVGGCSWCLRSRSLWSTRWHTGTTREGGWIDGSCGRSTGRRRTSGRRTSRAAGSLIHIWSTARGSSRVSTTLVVIIVIIVVIIVVIVVVGATVPMRSHSASGAFTDNVDIPGMTTFGSRVTFAGFRAGLAMLEGLDVLARVQVRRGIHLTSKNGLNGSHRKSTGDKSIPCHIASNAQRKGERRGNSVEEKGSEEESRSYVNHC